MRVNIVFKKRKVGKTNITCVPFPPCREVHLDFRVFKASPLDGATTVHIFAYCPEIYTSLNFSSVMSGVCVCVCKNGLNMHLLSEFASITTGIFKKMLVNKCFCLLVHSGRIDTVYSRSCQLNIAILWDRGSVPSLLSEAHPSAPRPTINCGC